MSLERSITGSFLVVIFLGCISCQSTPLKVSVYYESLCPDSISFIDNELSENYEYFKDKILVDLVPYGKASQSKSSSGAWTFRCQHGSDECRGNKYQACALNQKKGQDSDVKFVNCAMTLADPSDPDGIKTCADENGYDWNDISTCAEGNKGGELLAAYGDRTHSLNPKLRFVPTIIFNDKFDQTIQNQCLRDLAKALCTNIADPKPSICKNY